MFELLTNKNTKILNKNFDLFLNEKGYSISWLNELIYNTVNLSGGVNRESLVNVSFILTKFLEEKFSIRIPYAYGGAHYQDSANYYNLELDKFYSNKFNGGINPNWGCELKSDMNFFNSEKYPLYGPDCTGYIMTLSRLIGIDKYNKSATDMRDGYYKKNSVFMPLGKVYTFGNELLNEIPNKDIFKTYYSCYDFNKYPGQKGDLLHQPGHVILITDVDFHNGIFYTSESAYKMGFIRTKYKIKDLINSGKFSLINLDDYYKNSKDVLAKYNFESYNEEEIVSRIRKK